jgi:hypothetical protein
MKKLLIAALAAGTFTAEAQLTMNAGDTYVYHFDTLQYMGTAIVPPAAGYFNLIFDGATVNSGDSLRMELFEGLAEGTPAAERTITPGTDLPFLQLDTAWTDREGSIRLMALAGTFTITQIDITRKNDNAPTGIDIYHLRFTPVPEPSTAAVAATGVVLVAAWKRRKCA